MEKETPRNRFNIRRRDIVLSTVLAASLSHGVNEVTTSGKTLTPETVYPDEIFKPVTLDLTERFDKERIPHSSLIVELPKPISKAEQKKLDQKMELEEIVEVMENNHDTFPKKYINDVEMYYPIYKDVADKYNLDWYLLFIVHEKETGASAGKNGFKPDSYYVGAMQRDPNVWGDDYVKKASEGLEHLAMFPQRHENDWSDIAAASKSLSANYYKYKEEGDSKKEAVLKALLLYSAEGPARQRFEMFKEYNEVFKDLNN